MLRAKGLTFQYFENAKQPVFENLDFEVPTGEITLLTGKSGSGKSTLAYILSGLYPENCGFLPQGEVTWDDVNIHTLTPDKRALYVSMMFQNPDLQFCMNNLENELLFCLENIGSPESERTDQIDQVVDAIGVRHLLTRSFHAMSGGEKQKCALCCILAIGSRCIILDEAFANIDTASAKELIALIRDLPVTVLAIEHNVSLWEGVYHNILSLDGTMPKVFDVTPELPAVSAPILVTRDLRINDICYPDMNFAAGSLNAIVGKSGVGKTTFFKTLTKQYKFQGEITLGGENLAKLRKKTIFSKCGIVFQNPANQFLALSVWEEIRFSVSRWHPKQSEAWKEEKTRELLALFQLESYRNYSPYLLSQGQQRRLAVLSMIAGSQDILLLDEPTYGQDYENICAIMALLLQKAREGLTVIYATHNEHLAEHFSHQLIRLGDSSHV